MKGMYSKNILQILNFNVLVLQNTFFDRKMHYNRINEYYFSISNNNVVNKIQFSSIVNIFLNLKNLK